MKRKAAMQIFCRVIFFFSFAVFLSGCTDTDTNCGIADLLKQLDEQQVNGRTYFLVLRVSGAQDKVEFLQLYDRKPQLGSSCAKEKLEPIDSQALEENQPVKKVILKNEKLEIISPQEKEQSIALEELKLTIPE